MPGSATCKPIVAKILNDTKPAMKRWTHVAPDPRRPSGKPASSLKQPSRNGNPLQGSAPDHAAPIERPRSANGLRIAVIGFTAVVPSCRRSWLPAIFRFYRFPA
jgi:hypothetical protein